MYFLYIVFCLHVTLFPLTTSVPHHTNTFCLNNGLCIPTGTSYRTKVPLSRFAVLFQSSARIIVSLFSVIVDIISEMFELQFPSHHLNDRRSILLALIQIRNVTKNRFPTSLYVLHEHAAFAVCLNVYIFLCLDHIVHVCASVDGHRHINRHKRKKKTRKINRKINRKIDKIQEKHL